MKLVITGVGCWTAFGKGATTTFEGWCSGRSCIGGGGPFPGKGPVAAIPGGPHLTSDLAIEVVREALGELPVDGVGLVGGTTSGDMVRGEVEYEAWRREQPVGDDFLWAQLADRPTQRVAAALEMNGPRVSISTACSSGAAAVGIAMDWVRSGRAPAVVAFGADALCRMTVHGFGSLGAMSPTGALPFAEERTGLSLGEGAAALLIEREEHAVARGATVLAELVGYGNAGDAHHMTAPHPEGRGARVAVLEAGLDGVDWVCAHGTATPLNDPMEAAVLGELLPGVPVSSIKGAIGHTLGAAGAIELVQTVLALVHQRVPPNTGGGTGLGKVEATTGGPAELRAALSVNFAFGGHNTAVRVQR